MEYKDLYYTDNNEHAAFLLACKQTLESFYWAKGASVFVFENEPKCKRIIAGILAGEISINPVSLIEALRTVNGIINLHFYN
jgi:hypothetical protein